MMKESIVNFFRSDFQNYAFLLIAFALPLTKEYTPILMSLWVFSCIISFRKFKIQSYFSNWVMIFPLIFYLMHLIGLFYSENIRSGLFDLEVKLTIFLIPIATIYILKNSKINFNLILRIFVLGNLIASFICLFIASKNSLSVNEIGSYVFELSSWPTITKELNIVQIINRGLSNYSYTYLSQIHHPAYFSMYIVFSIVILGYFIKTGERIFFYSILIIYFTLFLWLLNSRAAYVSYISLFFVFCISIIFKMKKYWIGLIILFFGTILFLFIISNSRLNKNIKESVLILTNNRTLNQDSDIRLWIWKSGIEISKENLFVGVGTGDIDEELNKKYNRYQLNAAAKQNLNTHNQYLDVAIKLGLVGFIVLMAWLITIFVVSIKRRQFLLFYFCIIISINFLFETVLNTIAGVSFVVFFYTLLYSMYNTTRNTEVTRKV